ncbi:hypothetical protein JKG68_20025 [Microvirga aerilata]|uniref:Uncharacterized protein n=1 Tax=Microvirga aerilata TaxID=670292 RepID=A0A936Z998_9HYPH|nr:hypothetical protein [Microvirga aerilata]MBL0406251.1 hypothetical protein [Microvirga aerilata]
MSKAPQTPGPNSHPLGDGAGEQDPPATVASLGVQARLVPIDPARDHELASLIARCDAVFREWERLVRQAVHLLGNDPAAGSGRRHFEPDSEQP